LAANWRIERSPLSSAKDLWNGSIENLGVMIDQSSSRLPLM